ncbi:hypothetical protein MKZ38_001447 [Zalerion maritima]|uniref:Uncharacterized protein n=1 Tax=Zalerion maritima TaxID=339359 RepID=A0AAD5RXG7_9PEZI|nr:hypothetical protein MKZ38_001447 [Zalerion maritima]
MIRDFLRVAATAVSILSLTTQSLASKASGSRSQSSWNPPRETVTSSPNERADGPTPTPSPVNFGGFPLRARYYDDSETCGYDPNDEYGYGVYCAWGSCVTSGDFWGCCTTWYEDDISCTTAMQTTCTEVDEEYYYTMTEQYYDASSTMTCYPYYYTYDDGSTDTYDDYAFCATFISTQGTQVFSSYTCSSVKTTITMIDEQEYLSTYNIYDGYTGEYTPPNYSTISSSSSSSTATAGSSSETLSAQEIAKEQPKMVGAIVGGVLGGIVLVGAGTFGAVYLWLKMYPDPKPTGESAAAGSSESTPASEIAAGPSVTAPEPVHGGGNNVSEPNRPRSS